MCASPSGAVRIVALPRTTSFQPAGATNVLPATVVFGVSAAISSGVGSGSGGGFVSTTGGGVSADVTGGAGTVVFGPEPEHAITNSSKQRRMPRSLIRRARRVDRRGQI